MHKINQTPWSSAIQEEAKRRARAVASPRVWTRGTIAVAAVTLEGLNGGNRFETHTHIHTVFSERSRGPPMINRDAQEIELLCRDNNKWCTHNRRAGLLSPAVCRAANAIAIAPTLRHSFATHCFISEREAERGAAVCLILPLSLRVASRRSGKTLSSRGYMAKATHQFVESRGKTSRPNYFQTHYSAVRSGRVIHSKRFNPFARCFSLNCFFYVTCESYYGNSLSLDAAPPRRSALFARSTKDRAWDPKSNNHAARGININTIFSRI